MSPQVPLYLFALGLAVGWAIGIGWRKPAALRQDRPCRGPDPALEPATRAADAPQEEAPQAAQAAPLAAPAHPAPQEEVQRDEPVLRPVGQRQDARDTPGGRGLGHGAPGGQGQEGVVLEHDDLGAGGVDWGPFGLHARTVLQMRAVELERACRLISIVPGMRTYEGRFGRYERMRWSGGMAVKIVWRPTVFVVGGVSRCE